VEPVKCDIRIVTATRKSLEALVRAGTFREDLYYRIKAAFCHGSSGNPQIRRPISQNQSWRETR
jgi:sigma54-dependent transcription regulator